MKVYFGSSPRIKEQYEKQILKIYELIKKFGFKHTSDFIVRVDPDQYFKLKPDAFTQIHQRNLKSIKQAEIAVFESSLHDLSLSFLLNFCLELGKPVVILSQDKEVLMAFENVKTENVFLVHYSDEDLEEKLKNALEQARKKVDIRFNFFVTPQILAYLDWLSKRKRIPRAVYLRSLIEKEMKKDVEFKEEVLTEK